MSTFFNDSPIQAPSEDRFGIDPFARALAQSFLGITTPVGATIALNGAWGSGKSSAVNLIRHHLSTAAAAEKITIVDFNCWWFRGEEALTLAFLQTLNAALVKTLGDKARELVPKLGRKLLQAGPVIGTALNLATGSGWGSLLSGSIDFTKRFFPDNESVEKIFEQLSDALSQQNKRFLVIIDDIDRLAPDEALLIFRLVKSVGRLPNVMYLVVFDRDLAERAVAQRYPSEGPHFLEKIIQASFDLPLPARDEINSAFLGEVERICGSPSDENTVRRFMNIFYDAVAPYLNSPRDLTRLVNSIAVSWPPVANEVNLADFVALEVMRVFEGKLYSVVRSSKDRLCGVRERYGKREEPEERVKELLAAVHENRRQPAEDALLRLFPRLGKMGYGPEFIEQWEAERLVCSARHFDIYFRMSVGSDALTMREIDEFVERCGDKSYVKRAFKSALESTRTSGKSKVPLLFDEINVHASRVETSNILPLISALFEIGDDIDREEDRDRGFSVGSNSLRLHWLIRRLTLGRCELPERSRIFLEACQEAQLGWLVDFTSSAVEDYNPREGQAPAPSEKCLLTQEDVRALRMLALTAIHKASKFRDLLTHPRLAYILFRWRELAEDDGTAARDWTGRTMVDDTAAALLAKAFTGESWIQGMGMFGQGDRVATRRARVSLKSLASVIDVDEFHRRLRDNEKRGSLQDPYRQFVRTYLAAAERSERGDDD